MKQIMKEYLFQEELISTQPFKYQALQSQTIKYPLDNKGAELKLTFSVEKLRNTRHLLPMERPGTRLLIGRFVLVDKRKPCRIRSIHRNGSCDIILLETNKVITNVPMDRISPIERYGVNVYDINNMPYSIKHS